MSPKKQMESGVLPEDVQCKDNKVLVIRDNGKVACVTKRVADKLDWEIIRTSFHTNDVMKEIPVNHNDNSTSENTLQIPPQEPDKPTKKMAEIYDDTIQETIDMDSTARHVTNKHIFKPQDIAALIPQDITFDYVVHMPPENPDEFVQNLVDFADDKILEKHVFERDKSIMYDNTIRYDTEKGTVEVYLSPDRIISVTYTFFGPGRINPNLGQEVTNNLLEHLGIDSKTTIPYKEAPMTGANFSYWYNQKIGDLFVASNRIITDFKPGYTFFFIGKWNDNLDEMNLYDLEKSKQNAKNYLSGFDESIVPKCDVVIGSLDRVPAWLYIIEGRPLYQIEIGVCATPTYSGQWFEVYVDALTGTPLFAR